MPKTEFGIITGFGAEITALIYVNNSTLTENASHAQPRDETGKTVEIIGFSVDRTITADGILKKDQAANLRAGQKFTVNGVDWFIQSFTQTESNQETVRISFTLLGADDAEITPISDGAEVIP